MCEGLERQSVLKIGRKTDRSRWRGRFSAIDTFSRVTLALVTVLGLYSYPAHAELVASVLPSSRATSVDTPVTVFASVINTPGSTSSKQSLLGVIDGETAAQNCRVTLLGEHPIHFSFQETDPLTNAPLGIANMPTTIAANGIASFVLTLEPWAEISTEALEFGFSCDDVGLAQILPGINTLAFSATTNPGPDLIAVSASLGSDGVAQLTENTSSREICGDTTTSCGYEAAFAVAAINIGSSGSDLIVQAETDTGATLGLCVTEVATGACVAAPTGANVTFDLDSEAVGTYSVFVHSAYKLGFDAARSRVRVSFLDSTGLLLGASSIAIAGKRDEWAAWHDQTNGMSLLRVTGEVFAKTPCNEAYAVVTPGQEPNADYLQLDVRFDAALQSDQNCRQISTIVPVDFVLPDYSADHRGVVINLPSGLSAVAEIADTL